MANGHGGARPGAGRKRQEAVAAQAARRQVVLAIFNEQRLTRLLEKWAVLAEEEPHVIYPLLPYIFGAARSAEASQASAELTVRIVTVDDRDRRPAIRALDAS